MQKIDNGMWYTWYDRKFDAKKYLYHYTSINAALKILDSEKLRFSMISRANDTIESKPKIEFPYDDSDSDIEEKISTVKDHIQNINKYHIALLCFSKDAPKSKNNAGKEKSQTSIDENQYYTDLSGRGFALPRMWAQYAEDNCGVCLMFNREKLLSEVNKQLSGFFIEAMDVTYKKNFECVKLDKELFDSIYLQLSQDKSILVMNSFLKDKANRDFVIYNYFTKSMDWKNENEFRILMCFDKSANAKFYYLNHIFDFLEGIIIGENTSETDENLISLLADASNHSQNKEKVTLTSKSKKVIPVKKLYFDLDGCHFFDK